MAEEYQDMHSCDEYAAHPADPNRWAKGVTDEEIIPGPAVKFCREAVDDYPDTPRFQFQLGRALWAANKIEEGIEVFFKLEEKSEYGPVYAYLGDVYMYGLGGLEVDQDLAISLYQIAEESGFSPAEDVLASLQEGDEVTGDQEVAETPTSAQAIERPPAAVEETAVQEVAFNPRDYTQPEIMQALYTGNLSKLKVTNAGKTNYANLDNTIIYLANLNSQFSGDYNFKDPNCIMLYNPQVERQLQSKALSGVFGNELNMGYGSGNMPTAGLKAFGEMLNGFAKGGFGNVIAVEQAAEALKASAEKDGASLIIKHQCTSQVVKRIYANIEAYALGTSPVLTAEEKARQEQERIETERKAREEAERLALEKKKQREEGLRTSARNSCNKAFNNSEFCSCIVSSLDEFSIEDSEWSQLGQDFQKVLSVGAKHDGFSDRLRSCRS
ncbi:hypothetical protein ACQQ2Q_12930 [Agrobacterium sp. ES01]|uniref:tetratricopeptide repeat protein n=1 Tax=Agrobacterium sp. ES01 TaxID=3420714 RepID=UPI003D0D1448